MLYQILFYKIPKYVLIATILGLFCVGNLHAGTGGLLDNPDLLKMFSQATVLRSEKKYNEAIKEVNRVLLENKANAGVQFLGHIRLGSYEHQLKNYEASIKEYQRAIDCAPSDATDVKSAIAMASSDIGLNYLKLKQYSNASSQFMKIVDNYGDVDIYGKEGVDGVVVMCHWSHQNAQGIENILLGIIQKHANHKVKFFALGALVNHYVEQHDYDKALSTCQQILNELSVEKYPDLKNMKEKEIPNLIQNINTQKANNK